MSELSYSSPVSVLLTLGEGRRQSEWPDYSAYGLTEDHIPDLIRMVTDEQLHMADAESGEPGRLSTPGAHWVNCAPKAPSSP